MRRSQRNQLRPQLLASFQKRSVVKICGTRRKIVEKQGKPVPEGTSRETPSYHSPLIRDLGSFRELTRLTGTKKGAKNDGKGVPATRL